MNKIDGGEMIISADHKFTTITIYASKLRIKTIWNNSLITCIFYGYLVSTNPLVLTNQTQTTSTPP